jgi:hypothetical protein
MHQTAEIEAIKMSKRLRKQNRNTEKFARESEAHTLEVLSIEPASHPFAPAINIYLR